MWEGQRTRIRRGGVKIAILTLLAEGSRHGYDVLRAFQERRWGSPGPGSVYPVLAALEAAHLVTSHEEEGKRVYTITDEGRSTLEREADRFREIFASGGDAAESESGHAEALRESVERLMRAVAHVSPSSKAETLERVREILERSRKDIYTLLAEE
jgi:DNA-binding PadR family transcriptional regulator